MLNKLEAWLMGLACGLIVVGILGIALFLRQHQSKIYPGVFVDGVNVGGLSVPAARASLPPEFDVSQKTVEIIVDNISIASSSAELGLHKDYDSVLDTALNYGKSGWLPQQLIAVLDLKLRPVHFSSQLSYDQTAVENMVQELAEKVDVQPTQPFAVLKTSGNPASLVINGGLPGRILDSTQTQQLVLADTSLLSSSITAPVASVGAQLTADQQTQANDRAKKFVSKRLVFRSPDSTIHLNDQAAVELLAFPEGFADDNLAELATTWKESIDRPPQDAEFSYDPETLAVTSFKPSRDGLTLNSGETKATITQALSQLELEDSPDVIETNLALRAEAPPVTLADTNDLGIQELIGLGESEYDHSIPSRIHNVSLTTSKISNHIVKPGEEFSFNKALGDVSAATGFQPAYVIMNGQTVLGDGGGVCQVSTTLFRAVLDAGLDITKRRAHSYRVSYYELNSKPGVDATVYSGDVDLRFVNDTGHHILIHAEADSKNLAMKVELYGTSDGRTTEIVNHRTWDYRPAPVAVYIPDPTLAPGQTKQIDWAATGIKASFTNVIKDKDGQVIREDTYNSNYIPWSAKYLQGTGG